MVGRLRRLSSGLAPPCGLLYLCIVTPVRGAAAGAGWPGPRAAGAAGFAAGAAGFAASAPVAAGTNCHAEYVVAPLNDS
jgi:hypothetical protein